MYHSRLNSATLFHFVKFPFVDLAEAFRLQQSPHHISEPWFQRYDAESLMTAREHTLLQQRRRPLREITDRWRSCQRSCNEFFWSQNVSSRPASPGPNWGEKSNIGDCLESFPHLLTTGELCNSPKESLERDWKVCKSKCGRTPGANKHDCYQKSSNLSWTVQHQHKSSSLTSLYGKLLTD